MKALSYSTLANRHLQTAHLARISSGRGQADVRRGQQHHQGESALCSSSCTNRSACSGVQPFCREERINTVPKQRNRMNVSLSLSSRRFLPSSHLSLALARRFPV
eukprot:4457016-Pleurochrysis_carterae.AAC.1